MTNLTPYSTFTFKARARAFQSFCGESVVIKKQADRFLLILHSTHQTVEAIGVDNVDGGGVRSVPSRTGNQTRR